MGANGNVTLKADDIPTATAGKSAPIGYYDVFYEVLDEVSPDVGTLPVIHITDQDDNNDNNNDQKNPPAPTPITPKSSRSSSSGCDMCLSGLLALALTGIAVLFRKH